jgi:hypothetical protein
MRSLAGAHGAIRALTALCVLAALAGCGGPGNCGKPGIYAGSTPGPPLRVPEDLSEPPTNDAFALPDPPGRSESLPCGYYPPKINEPRTAAAAAAPAAGSGAPEEGATEAVPPPAEPAPAAPATAEPAVPASGTPAAEAQVASADEALASELRAFVAEWAGSWAAGNFEEYLRYYAQDFDPPGDLTLEEWRTARQTRLEKRPTTQVQTETLEVTESTPDRVTVEFVQRSELDGVASSLMKGLVLVREDGAWRIQKELVVDVLSAP